MCASQTHFAKALGLSTSVALFLSVGAVLRVGFWWREVGGETRAVLSARLSTNTTMPGRHSGYIFCATLPCPILIEAAPLNPPRSLSRELSQLARVY